MPARWFVVFVLLLVGSNGLLYYAATREKRRVVLVVNGQEVTRESLDLALAHYRDQALTDLGTQVVVAQAAQKVGVAVDDEDLADKQSMDAELRWATLVRLRTELLLRKLVLAKVKKQEREEIYHVFGAELTGYRLSYILLLENTDVAALDLERRTGTSFERIQAKYGKKNPPELTPQLLQPLRPEQLWELFGRRGSAIVMALQVGKVSPPLMSGLGMVLVRLDAREDSYEQLQQAINQTLFEARKNQVLQELAENTSISSPLTWSATRRKPVNIYGDKIEDLAKPKPTSISTPKALPQPRPIPARPVPDTSSSPTPGSGKVAPVAPLKIKLTAPEYVKGPLNAKITTTTCRILPGRWKGQAVLRLDSNNNHHPDEQEPILVRITADGWQSVEELEGSLDRYAVEQDMGYWVDQVATRQVGPLWARKEVVDRPANGVIEAEEVTLKEFRRSTRLFQGNHFHLGAEIFRDDQGRLFHYEQTAQFPARREVDPKDVERLKIYRDSDANWEVRVEP